MVRTKYFFIIIAFILFFLILFFKNLPNNKMKVVFCDVGQGDAILLTKGWLQILIDVGEFENINTCLTNNISFFDRNIEFLLLTHPDSDHIGGLNYFFDSFNFSYLIANNYLFESEKFIEIKEKFEDNFKKAAIINAEEIENLILGGLIELNFISSSKIFISSLNKLGELNPNNNSLIIKLIVDDVSFFLGGDIENEVESILVKNSLIENFDVLKVNHHGSQTSSSLEFLELIKPKISVIQVGLNNRYGHPHNDVITRISMYSNDVYRNDKDGEIRFLIKDGLIFLE